MKKFITIAGAILLGSAASLEMTDDRVVNALEKEVRVAERDV